MKIESIIRRKAGTRIQLEEQHYHFKPTEEDERHCAEVGIEAHVERLLSITEGFRPADEPATEAPKIKGSVVHPALFTLTNGETLTLAELTSRAFTASGMDLTAWNALSDQERYEQLDTTLGEINEELVAPSAPTLEPETKDEPATTETKTVDEADDESVDEETVAKDEPATEAVLNREALATQYEAKFGKKPHHKLSAERIKQVLEDA